jgi:hypothetical protein
MPAVRPRFHLAPCSKIRGHFLEALRSGIVDLTRARLRSLKASDGGSNDIDVLFDRLCDIERKFGGDIYNVVRDQANFYELMMDGQICGTIKSPIGTSNIQLPFDLCLFLVQRPFENKYTYEWHNDYVYNLLSLNAITAWIPLTDVTAEMGALVISLGSHKAFTPIIVETPDFQAGQGGGGKVYSLDTDLEVVERNAITVPAAAGDVLLLHSLVLHRSGKNVAKRSRWIANPRYSSLFDFALVDRGWLSGRAYARPKFQDVHPEFCRLRGEQPSNGVLNQR